MYAQLDVDKNGKVKNTPSLFKGTKAEKDATAAALYDWQIGYDIQSKSYAEFNNRSLLQEIDTNQKAFNSYVPPKSEDPDEMWRAQTVRPITRNKLISIAAHVTVTVLYPNVFAQNDRDEEDKEAALVMRDLIEWVIENSNYSREFIIAVISALVDPAVIVHQSFQKVMRTVRYMQETGAFTEKEIVDEILSGFISNVVPVKELMIANIFEHDIQKQRFLMRSRYVDYSEAEQVYGKHKNWKYVTPGVKAVFNDENRTFYDVKDTDCKASHLVHEVTYYNRTKDLELCFINGIIVTEPNRPNPRLDKRYPFAKSGYEPINNGKFFYYKSAANKLSSDQSIVDTLYNMILDGSFLSLMPPMANYGGEAIDASVSIPGMITDFQNPDSKLEAILPRTDLRAGMESISMVERSMSESSLDPAQMGQSGKGGQTAREVLLQEKNARIALGLFGKMIGFLVEDIGTLITGDIIQYMTMAEVNDIASPKGLVSYKKIVLPNKVMNGKKVTKQIEFSIDDFSEDMTEDDYMDASFDLLEKEAGTEKKIYKVNPIALRNLKYKISTNVDELNPKSKALEKALNLELYDRAINNPLADQDSVTRDFLFEVYKPGESDKYIKKAAPTAQPNFTPDARNVNTNLVGQLTGGNSLGIAASSEM